jgi:hypothetical protein
MDEAAWGALALALTLLGGFYTYLTYQRRGPTPALRGAGLTLLPVAAWLTGGLRLLTEVGDAVGDWAVRLAFSPSLWAGVVLAGLAVVLFVVSGFLGQRDIGTRPRTPQGTEPGPGRPEARGKTKGKGLPAAPAPAADPMVDDLAEIEAILRKRGIQ